MVLACLFQAIYLFLCGALLHPVCTCCLIIVGSYTKRLPCLLQPDTGLLGCSVQLLRPVSLLLKGLLRQDTYLALFQSIQKRRWLMILQTLTFLTSASGDFHVEASDPVNISVPVCTCLGTVEACNLLMLLNQIFPIHPYNRSKALIVMTRQWH